MLEKIKFEGAFAEVKFAKHIFLANKKKKDVQFKEHMWLVVAAHDTPFTNKDLEKLCGVIGRDAESVKFGLSLKR